jgi:[ribosomal protein S5]-alanine N-acetyltransferase
MIFETERLVVRTLEPTDGDRYFSLHGDPVIMKYIRAASTREQCDALLLDHIAQNQVLHPFGRWLVYEKNSGAFVGSFVVIPIVNTDLMQLGYSLLKDNWGKGYATELTKAGLHYLFTKTPLTTIYAIAEEENIASRKALLKAGFQEESWLADGDKRLQRFVMKKQ